jgi:hypothetical protein
LEFCSASELCSRFGSFAPPAASLLPEKPDPLVRFRASLGVSIRRRGTHHPRLSLPPCPFPGLRGLPLTTGPLVSNATLRLLTSCPL